MRKLGFGILAVSCLVVLVAAGCNTTKSDTDTNSADANMTKDSSATMQTNEQTSVKPKPKTVTVSYTASGYSPSSITINSGDTIKFVNNSSDNFWPASGPHPIHTAVPGFDAKQPIAPGGSYSFTFTKVGTFPFHNHLNPSQSGSIVVE